MMFLHVELALHLALYSLIHSFSLQLNDDRVLIGSNARPKSPANRENRSVLEAAFGADVVQNLAELLVLEPALQRWYQGFGLFRCFRAQIAQGGQLEFVQLLLAQQTVDGSSKERINAAELDILNGSACQRISQHIDTNAKCMNERMPKCEIFRAALTFEWP